MDMSLREYSFRVRRLILWVTLVASGVLGQGRAQETLTLDQSLALAKEHSPRLRLAANAVRVAELSVSEVGTTGLPQISAAAGGTYTPVPPKYGYDPAITDGGQLSGQITVRQSLYDGGMRGLKLDQLQLDIRRAVHERELAGLDLVLAVKQAFAEALRTQEEVSLRQESVEELSTYGDLVRRLYGGGAAGYADVLRSEMQTSSASLALDKARESFAAARLTLAELIGVAVDSTVKFEGSPVEVSSLTADTGEVAQTLDMKVAGLVVEKGQLDIQMANHEAYPVLSLVADAGYLSSGDNLRLPRDSRLNTIGYSVGLGIEIPLFTWGAIGMRVEERELAADDLRQQMELLRRSILAETQIVTLQLSRARARLIVLQETIQKAQSNFLLAKSKYAAGGALALEVLTAQQLLTDTKVEELQTESDLRVLAARLERLTASEQTVNRR